MPDPIIAGVDFAAIADDLREPTSCLPEMSFAAYLEMTTVGETRKHLEHLAARTGLNPAATNLILDRETKRAKHLYQAHRLLTLLIPYEREIKAMLSA